MILSCTETNSAVKCVHVIKNKHPFNGLFSGAAWIKQH